MSHRIITAAITAVLTMSAAHLAYADTAMTMSAKGMEKCYGIAKIGQNDCGTARHHCAGEAKMTGDKTDWLLIPTGLCKKIVGGSIKGS